VGSISRKIARNKAKSLKNHFKKKINMFSSLGDECISCQKPFDKTSKEQVFSWYVVVREDKNQVRLYCPTCWEMAEKATAQVMGGQNEDQGGS
tara:strand:- start:16 stop:294 length:279 start_codon:yes stop_codon:yes gene_type:complete